jgi:CRISPR type III-A-associated protein Csm2
MRQQQGGQVLVNSEEIKQIVRDENYELLVQRSEVWGQELRRQKLTRAQIRRVYKEVKRLQMRWDPVRLRMLKPRLAYIASRQQQEARGGQLLRQILTPAIDAVFEAQDENGQQQRFKVLADLFEALLAYFYAAERQGGR